MMGFLAIYTSVATFAAGSLLAFRGDEASAILFSISVLAFVSRVFYDYHRAVEVKR
jgi:hypothetical protein